MITKENYSEEHIRLLQGGTRRDPLLIERALFAFGLLEALAQVGMEFTFKGGTSLILLLPKPMRLSTDIDIVVKPGTDVDEYIRQASVIFPFKSGGEQFRNKRGSLEKRHFKFFYDSPLHGGEPFYILLDILFEENHYEQVIQKEIANEMLLTEGSNLFVSIPTIDCVLGDKLTAFAPYTTGIPLRGDKEKYLEIMKQFFDVSTLIDEFSDFGCVSRTYYEFDLFRIHVWELFVCTVTYMLHYEMYSDIHDLLVHTYFMRTSGLGEEKRPVSYEWIRFHSRMIEEIIKPSLEGDMSRTRSPRR